jgi:hypothetical protein
MEQSYMMNPPRTAGSLRSRVEQLKLETVSLNVQIHELSENDESKNNRIQRLEAELESYKSLKINLAKSLEKSQETTRVLVEGTEGKDDLHLTVTNLSKQIGQQKSSDDAQNAMLKLPAAFREFKRLDSETIRLKSLYEHSEAESEKDNLGNLMAQLGKQLEEITLLRSENVSRRRSLNCSNAKIEKDIENSEEMTHLKYQIRKLAAIDKTKDVKIDQLQSELAKCVSSKATLAKCLEESQEHIRGLEKSVSASDERLEIQSKKLSEAQVLWQKFPAAIRSLKRLDDETVKMRRDSSDSKDQSGNENYPKIIAHLQKEKEILHEQVASLKAENDIQRCAAQDSKNAFERLKLTSTASIITLVEKLEESRSKILSCKGS